MKRTMKATLNGGANLSTRPTENSVRIFRCFIQRIREECFMFSSYREECYDRNPLNGAYRMPKTDENYDNKMRNILLQHPIHDIWVAWKKNVMKLSYHLPQGCGGIFKRVRLLEELVKQLSCQGALHFAHVLYVFSRVHAIL